MIARLVLKSYIWPWVEDNLDFESKN